MQSRWNDHDARAFVTRYAEHGEDVALRVYTSRLIGQDPDLVLHGGGNTSVKTMRMDALGRSLQCLCVKGSGADLSEVEPQGLPALELEPLLALRSLPSLSDAAMVQELRRRLLDPAAPNPSVEALLHAFVPHRFVDHTHADAILALTNQPDGERLVREALGDDVAILGWIFPGFPLAKAVDDIAPHVPPSAERAPLPTGWHKPKGESRGKVGLFTGCVMEPIFGRINRATLQLLLANGFEVFVPAAQKCCGALLVHAGLPDDAAKVARENTKAFAEVDFVVNNSAGCGCAMREYGELLGDEAGRTFAAKCRDVSEFLAERGLVATPARCESKVAYDDPCHLCHGQKVRTQPRELLAKVPGIALVQHDRPEDCCGSAGIYNMLQPELAQDIGARKAEALCAAKPDLVATGNPGCMMQIAAHLKAAGSNARVVHPVELLLPEARD